MHPLKLARRAASYRRAIGRATGVRLAGELEQAAEQMSGGDSVRQIVQLWSEIPLDLKMAMWRNLQQFWLVRHGYYARAMAAANEVFRRNRAYWQQMLLRNPGGGISQLANTVARNAGLKPRKRSGPGMSRTQVRQYHGRQTARGIVPGRDPRRRLREMELELEFAASELEAAASGGGSF